MATMTDCPRDTTPQSPPCPVCAEREADEYLSILAAHRRLGMHLEAEHLTAELQRHFPHDRRFNPDYDDQEEYAS